MPHELDELVFVGGDHTVEARNLADAAADAGLRIRRLDFAGTAGQAAFAAQGPGSVRLPLVIVGGRYSLQQPRFVEVEACVEMLNTGGTDLPPGCVPVSLPTSD